MCIRDRDGNANSDLSQYSGLAVGVPGTVAGMQMALEKYGTMSLSEVLQPAIKLARDGFIVTTGLSDSLIDSQNELKLWPSTVKVFFKPDGTTSVSYTHLDVYKRQLSFRLRTYVGVIEDTLDSMYRSGFRKILLVNGHGGNTPATTVIAEWLNRNRDASVQFHDW